MAERVTVEDLRWEIDRIDREIVVSLSARLEVARRLGELKRAAGLPLYDAAREDEVISRAGRAPEGEHVVEIYKVIVNETRRLQYEAMEVCDDRAA